MNHSTPGIPVHHQLLVFTQTHVHWVGDTIQLSHSLTSASPPAFNLSQNQGLFQWVSCLYQEAKVLKFQLQHQSFQWVFRIDFLSTIDWFDLSAVQGTLKSLLQHHSWKHQLFDTQPSLWSNFHILHDYWQNHSFDYMDLKDCCQVTSVVFDSVQPHRQQPTRLLCLWDSPGQNTGVGCHFLLQCMKVKSESKVAQSYLTLSDPMDCSLPGFSIHGIFQARILEWVAIRTSGFKSKPNLAITLRLEAQA